jgi:hypothetical protein
VKRTWLSTNLKKVLRSTRVPRGSSGVAPELSLPAIFRISGAKKFAERCFRRDAGNDTPEAYPPRNVRTK